MSASLPPYTQGSFINKGIWKVFSLEAAVCFQLTFIIIMIGTKFILWNIYNYFFPKPLKQQCLLKYLLFIRHDHEVKNVEFWRSIERMAEKRKMLKSSIGPSCALQVKKCWVSYSQKKGSGRKAKLPKPVCLRGVREHLHSRGLQAGRLWLEPHSE